MPTMLQRRRSASSPRDIGENFFLSEVDLHSDIYDDTVDSDENVSDNEKILASTLSIADTTSVDDSPSNTSLIMKIALAVISGFMSNVLFELLVEMEPSSSLLAALVLHIWIVAACLPNAGEYIAAPRIPMRWHALIVFLSFAFLYFKSVATLYLPMPVFIVCTNLQLVAGLVVGKYLFGRTFSASQYLSVVVISAGCILMTISSSGSAPGGATNLPYGLSCIFVAILAISVMIPTGSMLIQRYNADVCEHIFLQHFLSLPLFALQWESLQPSLRVITSPEHSVNVLGFSIPISIVLLLGTTLCAQANRYYTMEISVELNCLASQLVNNANKTLALVVSLVCFNAPPWPSAYVWAGVALQTIGSLVYVSSSFSDATTGDFKPNTRIKRLRRVSWSGAAISLGLSDSDLRHLRDVVKSNTEGKMHRSVSDSLMSEALQRIDECGSEGDASDTDVPIPVARAKSYQPQSGCG
eukprot:CAMPEP_0185039698 /NCGR_PEP_ID=MMETSP1103-20130426/36834_1 /TAXON_ID=36769 /ORGANISM="Paraphysomonas bandaiensis, Strain Caron Lab Isolate" /LENGTH=469 /DNA_ID=CAMNT_0027578697 /DNA_START=160 /DNA_END=1569 /DNA_ORIENTATION=+